VQDGGFPIIVGGKGRTRTPRLTARYAVEFNVPFETVAENARPFAGVRAACEDAGRDPSSMVYSSALVLCVGKDEAELARRAKVIGRDIAEPREHGVAGTRGGGGRPRPLRGGRRAAGVPAGARPRRPRPRGERGRSAAGLNLSRARLVEQRPPALVELLQEVAHRHGRAIA
jgi:alkanesulfonate monooxygenase SsuD/methylene tetrahydromethanopterin reductase-like flavin-dependent oxidoreductase (luciferase family)